MLAVALLAGAVNSLGVVLGQEMQRFNRLLHHVTASLQQLIKALKVQSPYPQNTRHHTTTMLPDSMAFWFSSVEALTL